MATTDRPDGPDTPDACAQQLASDEFVSFRVAPSMPSIVATTILTTGLDGRGIPYQVRMTPTLDSKDVTVAVGTSESPRTGIHLPASSVRSDAIHIAHALGDEPNTERERLGAVFSQRDPSEGAALGIPVVDVADGIAHSTLIHGRFSGDIDTAAAFLDGIDIDEPTSVASAVTLEVAKRGHPRSTQAIERFLGFGPRSDGPFASVAGEADVLDVLAEVDPGLALALASGGDRATKALETWRETATVLHEACRDVNETGNDTIVARDIECRAPGVLSRMLADFRTTAETVLIQGPDHAGITTDAIEPVRGALEPVVEWLVVHSHRRLTISGNPTEIDAALREVDA